MTNSDPAAATLRLLEVMARLLGAEGCPWDRAQTHRSLVPFLLEEAYELAEAIESGDDAAVREELGDVLLQVVFHARLAEQQGRFSFAAVAGRLADKLVARHPHVFTRDKLATAEQVVEAWERRKQAGRASRLDGIPEALPALMRAQKIGARAARAGFEWAATEDIRAKIREELDEFDAALAEARARLDGVQGEGVKEGGSPAGAADRSAQAGAPRGPLENVAEERGPAPQGDRADRTNAAMAGAELEFGDLLFALVQLARWSGVDAETALRRASRKFAERFRHMERALQAAGRDPRVLDSGTWWDLWELAKAEEQALNADAEDSSTAGGAVAGPSRPSPLPRKHSSR